MLQNKDKVASLWKNQQGWGSTHTERETFEELYRAYKGISSDSVLTYGKLIPRQESDEFFEQVKALDSTNPVLEYKESSFKTFPLIKKFVDYPLTKVSSNCNHSFVILDEEGNQLRNIIPYDYSDTGIYNYTLRTSNGEEIPWGLTDWIVDTNSSLLTFNNGVPEGVDANNPPTLTFYQYVGPVGERTYIDAALLDVEKVIFEDKNPVASFKDQAVEVLDQLEEGFYSKYLFTGSDTSEGIGLQFETLNSVIDSETGDPLKGYDDNSKGQVVSLLSHKTGVSENIEVLFASENLPVGTYTIQVTETELPSKIDLEEGFVVVKASLPGTYVVKVEESETIKAVLLVKDDVTNEFELFYPRQDLSLNLKLPTFIDLKKLPPHLKLSSMSSYSDHITPQYYGPRVADFVIASDDSVNNRSADFVVYNKEGFYLEDAIKAAEGKHIFLRNGTYEIQADSLELDQGQTIEGETLKGVLIRGNINCLTETYLKRFTLVGDITSENETTVTSVKAKKINLKSGLVKDSVAEEISSSLCFNCTCENFLIKEEAQLFNSSVTDTLSGKGLLILSSSNINKLDVPELDSKSIIDTTTIKEVVALPRSVKINSSYVTKFSESIDRDVYPDTLTFPFYKKFEERVYITFDDPFTYDEKANQIKIKLDTITTNPDTGILEPTIFINEKGELQVRPFFDRELPIEKPELLKTQIEEVYKQHADTTLETEKPTTVKDALIDLYWSKADLKGGKVPIDQLPDSVAYGGLSFVGMWSFEKHNGEYPTFADVDFSTMSDDNYTDLQRGWFFIVEGSTKEDDPCFPQTAIDGVEFTAGDWVVYEGKSKAPIVGNVRAQPLFNLAPVKKNYYTLLQRPEGSNKTTVWSSGQQYGKNKLIGLSTVIFFEDKVDLYKSDETGFHYVESFPVEYKMGILDAVLPDIEPYKTVVQIKIGDYLFDVKGTAVRTDKNGYDNLETQYIYKEDYLKENGTQHNPRLLLKATNEESQKWSEEVFGAIENGFCLRPTELQGWWKEEHKDSDTQLDLIDLVYEYLVRAYAGASLEQEYKWVKVDRAYLDPVYSRLPEMAPKTDGENPAWSILDGGEGLLRLSYLSLAEAIRLLNISLLKLSPDRPTEISKIKTVIDYEKTTAQEVTYITIPNDGQLNQLVLRETETAWKSDSGVVAIKQEGKTDLPLETCFYCGSESNIQLMDKLVEVDCQIERFDPYEKWRLGFKAPTGITGALVTGEIPLDTDFKETHQIKITQYDLVKPADIVDDVSKLEGETETLTFQEQRVFESTEGMDIGKCISIETNLQALNKLLKNNRTGGLGYLPKDTQFTSEFIVKDFTKYNVLSPKAKIEVRASFAGVPVPVRIESQLLKYKGDVEDTYDLDVHFTSDIFNGQNYCRGDLVIEAKATNFIETDWVEVGRLKDALVIDTKPEVVESGNSLYPTLNSTSDFKYFGGEYVPKVNNFDWEELAFVTDSFQWAEGKFVDSWITLEDEPIYIEQGSQSTKVGDSQFKFVTFKKELEGVCDITGFDLILNWAEAPELVKTTNALDKVIVQVCATSPSLNKDVLMDGNSAVPVFYKSTFKEGEACNYPGLSDVSKRRITFGRTTVPIETIYIRIGLPKGLKLKDIDIEY